MTSPAPTFGVRVDVRNPGQFFGCCGLLELAHRLWPGAEAWFDVADSQFFVVVRNPEATLAGLVEALRQCHVSGLTETERQEQKRLEAEKRKLKEENGVFAAEKEQRRKELGQRARKGALQLADPVALLLDWWQSSDDEATPKTWAGRQEINKIAQSAQEALPRNGDPGALLDHACVMRDGSKPVEPFYFDARRFAHALDAGFSLDVIEAETLAHPAVELLCLIGLQRFRPVVEVARKHKIKAFCDYWVWQHPLHAPVAAAAACGGAAVPRRQHYRFPLWARDDQKRYGAFGWSTRIGDNT